jgi:hypothetical protein
MVVLRDDRKTEGCQRIERKVAEMSCGKSRKKPGQQAAGDLKCAAEHLRRRSVKLYARLP